MSTVGASALASLVAVGRTVVVILCGVFLAKYRVKAGGPGAWRDLARLTAEFFLPCLVIASFTSGVTPAVLAELWPVVLLSFLLPCLWLALGALGGWLFFAPSQRRFVRFAAVTVAYPNAFALPFPLMVALTREVPWLREREGAEDFSATVLMLFSLFLLLQIWTVAFALYGAAAGKRSSSSAKEASPKKGDAVVDPSTGDCEGGNTPGDEETRGIDHQGTDQEHGPPAPTPNSEPRGVATPAVASRQPTVRSQYSLRHVSSVSGENAVRAIREILNPLVLSLLVALLISVSPLRSWFVESVVHETLDIVGSATVPLTLVQLGAGMARPPEIGGGAAAAADAALHWRSAAVIVVLRLLVGNVVGSAVVTAFRRAGWLEDRLVALCMYLVCCSPTAANVALVSSVQQAFVQPTGLVLFFMQLVSVLSITVSIAISVELLS